MKKKIILSLVSIFVLCTSFILPVSALTEEEIEAGFVDGNQYQGSFLGSDFPITYVTGYYDDELGYYVQNAPLYSAGGFNVSASIFGNEYGSDTGFNQAVTTNSVGSTYIVAFYIGFPDGLHSDKSYDITIKGTHNKNSSFSFSSVIFDYSFDNLAGYKSKVNYTSSTFDIRLTDVRVTNSVYNSQFAVYVVPTVINNSFVVTGITVREHDENAAALEGISDWLSILALNQNEIGVNVIAIRDYCVSIIEAINLGFAVTHEKIDLLKESMISKFDSVVSSINSNFSSLNSWIQNQTTSITSKLDDLLAYFKGNEQSNSSVDNNNQSSNNAGNTFDEYNDIESGYMNDMSSNLGSIDTSNNLFAMTDFMATGMFVSTQLENIYNSNVIIQNVVMYGLILGLAFTVIGISTKWG